jgi:hypothetical protein
VFVLIPLALMALAIESDNENAETKGLEPKTEKIIRYGSASIQWLGDAPFSTEGDPLERSGQFWSTSENKWMARDRKFGHWLYSEDGRGFQETNSNGSSAQGDIEEGSFFDGEDTKHFYSLNGRKLVIDGKEATPVNMRPSHARFIPLPEKREIAYCAKSNDGRLFIVTEDRNRGYDTFHLFIGHFPELERIPINNVIRYRDGGTTVIDTPEGEFYSPTPWKSKARPKWTDSEGKTLWLTPIEAKKIRVRETETSAVLSA